MSIKKDKKISDQEQSWRQFDIIEKIIEDRLAGLGEKPTMANMAKLLGVNIPKIQKWKNGQRPSFEDMQFLAQELGLSCEWLLLGIGQPLINHKSLKFNPDYVEICDTLHEWLRYLKDSRATIATIGGLRFEELNDCISSQSLPPLTTISRWIHHYKLNANHLIAQIGLPFLTEEEYTATGPLDWLRRKRNDYWRHLPHEEEEERENGFLDGRKIPEGPTAEQELINMVNEQFLEISRLKKSIAHNVEVESIELTNENRKLREDINGLYKTLSSVQATLSSVQAKRVELLERIANVPGAPIRKTKDAPGVSKA